MVSKLKTYALGFSKRGAVIGVVCALICILLSYTDSVQRLENSALDACFQLRGHRASKSKIVLVTIDDATLQQLGKPLVLISPEVAELIEYIDQLGAQAVGVDLVVPESAEALEQLRPGGLGDADQMGRAVGESGQVVLCELIKSDGHIETPLYQWLPLSPDWNDVGFANLTVDSDMCLRRQQLRASVGDDVRPSLALAVYAKSIGRTADWFRQQSLTIDGEAIPQSDDKMLVNYVGPHGTLPRISFIDLLNESRSQERPRSDLRDTIVLIGGEFEVQADAHATPFSHPANLMFLPASWRGYPRGLMSGVEVQGNVLATLVDQAFIVTPTLLRMPVLLILFGVVFGSVLYRLNLEQGAMLTIAHHFLWIVLCVVAFCFLSWRIGLIPMLLLVPIIYATVFARRWRLLRRMLGLFKSESVARSLEANPDQLDLQGQARVVSILFADIRGFTSFSEGNDAKTVVRLLNAYFAAIVPEIEQRGGVVNQYIGDGILVIYGAPEDQEDHARRAVATGLAILKKVESSQEDWKRLGAESLRIGVGIHTGVAITGIVGSPNRLDYTSIGDTVNTASRIESATKEVCVELLMSQQTLDAIPEEALREWRLRPVPHSIKVKGKREELTVYSLHASPQD